MTVHVAVVHMTIILLVSILWEPSMTTATISVVAITGQGPECKNVLSLMLVYYDQRVRKEAFDLQLLMEGLGSTSPTGAAQQNVLGAGGTNV